MALSEDVKLKNADRLAVGGSIDGNLVVVELFGASDQIFQCILTVAISDEQDGLVDSGSCRAAELGIGEVQGRFGVGGPSNLSDITNSSGHIRCLGVFAEAKDLLGVGIELKKSHTSVQGRDIQGFNQLGGCLFLVDKNALNTAGVINNHQEISLATACIQ